MYFPFLRGKKHELFAVSEMTELIRKTNKVIPVIEPVNLNATTARIIPEVNGCKVPMVFIINPQAGDLKGQGSEIFRPLLNDIENKELLTIGYFITDTTTVDEIQSKMEEFLDFSFAFIHTTNSKVANYVSKMDDRVRYHIFIDGKVSRAYINGFSGKLRVIIRDCYNAQARNVDYPNDEFFSDLFSTFKPEFYGFGDYQMVGSADRSGGPAHAVALHLTYLSEPNGQEVRIRHFISDDTETPSNVQGKYFQALRKLVDFLDAYESTTETIGCLQYRENLKDEQYHGLGFPKELSMKHHIELMSQII